MPTALEIHPPHGRRSPVLPWIAAALFYALLTVLFTDPLAFVAGTHALKPFDDPLLNAWLLWWNTHVLPLTSAWWNAPAFYPTTGVMAFSELLLGLLPITAPIQWLTHNPALALNVATLLSFPLCAITAHAVAFDLTRRHDAALLAGLAFGFAPIRANELGHVQMLSYYWAPIVLLALHRYLRTHRRGWLALFGAAFLMQVLCNGYALFQLPIVIGLWLIWFPTTWRERWSVIAALACAVMPLVPILLKYRDIQQSFHMSRGIGEVAEFSADIASLVSAHPEAYVLGHVLTWRQSYALFPGLTIVTLLAISAVVTVRRRRAALPVARTSMSLDRIVLLSVATAAGMIAASAVAFGPWKAAGVSVGHAYKPLTIAVFATVLFLARGPAFRRVWRARSTIAFYALAAAACYVCALGPEPRLLGMRVMYKAPYSWLMLLPGFDAVRAPDRLAMLGTLCLSIIIALIYTQWMSRKQTTMRGLWIVIAVGLVVDGAGRIYTSPLPAAGPATSWGDVTAVVELPLTQESDVPAMYRSIGYGRPVVNGSSGYMAPSYPALSRALATGEIGVLEELAPYGPIGIAIDRSSPEHARIEQAVAALRGVSLVSETTGWASFRLERSLVKRVSVGAPLAIKAIHANRHVEEAIHMSDGRIDTAWRTDTQAGGEEIVIELERFERVAGIVMRIGGCPFGSPRDLIVETSDDGALWTAGYRGSTATETYRAALSDPADVPIQVLVNPTAARFVRLRQVGQWLAPWCVGELSVHGPS